MSAKPNTIVTTPEPAKVAHKPAEAPVEATETEATETEGASEPKAPKTSMYVVAGAPVAPWGNGSAHKKAHGEKARMYQEGEVVELVASLARHYVKIGRLAPYVPDEDEG